MSFQIALILLFLFFVFFTGLSAVCELVTMYWEWHRRRLPSPDRTALRNRDWDENWEVSDEGHGRGP
jgi:hypothetical protein